MRRSDEEFMAEILCRKDKYEKAKRTRTKRNLALMMPFFVLVAVYGALMIPAMMPAGEGDSESAKYNGESGNESVATVGAGNQTVSPIGTAEAFILKPNTESGMGDYKIYALAVRYTTYMGEGIATATNVDDEETARELYTAIVNATEKGELAESAAPTDTKYKLTFYTENGARKYTVYEDCIYAESGGSGYYIAIDTDVYNELTVELDALLGG